MRFGKGVGVLAKGIGSASPSFVAQDQGDAEIVHPFKVSAYKDGNDIKVTVRAGTVNNLVPKLNGEFLDSDQTPTLTIPDLSIVRIYIKASASSPPVFFPNTLVIESATSDLADTDTNGYLKIASVTTDISVGLISVNQFVYASQVLVRAKPGTATALWSWSSR